MPTITNTRSPKPGVYPFWFWNGVQEESRIAEQLEAMKAGGCRGVVLHSREGNRIPYLSERWFELVLHSCDCAKRLGLTIWLYDEDGYPSGNAGMQVQKLRPDLRQKQMLFAYAGTDPDTPAYAAYDATTYAPLDETAVPRGTPALRFTPNFIDRHVDTFSREAAGLCHAGANALALDAERDMVYLEGDFVFEDGRLQAPRPLALGDLAAAGWPHSWGAVEYVFAFDGRRDVLRLALAGGAAEIRVNGRLADPVFGLPATVRIADLCADCANELVVRLHNTAANFVTANPARFGLVKAEIA